MNNSFWEKIIFGRVVVWYGVKWMIIHFFNASTPPSSCYFIQPFLQIVLVENSLCGKELNHFFPPNSSDDLCLLLSFFYGWKLQFGNKTMIPKLVHFESQSHVCCLFNSNYLWKSLRAECLNAEFS